MAPSMWQVFRNVESTQSKNRDRRGDQAMEENTGKRRCYLRFQKRFFRKGDGGPCIDQGLGVLERKNWPL